MLVWKSPSCLIIVVSQSVINTTVVSLSITRYSFQSFPSMLRSMQAKFSYRTINTLNLITLNVCVLDIIFIFRLLAYKLKLRSPVLCCACGDERCLTTSLYAIANNIQRQRQSKGGHTIVCLNEEKMRMKIEKQISMTKSPLKKYKYTLLHWCHA